MFDYCYNSTSILTKLRFKLKSDVTDKNLKKEFDVTLYPNSVFIMSLSTNRLYTHGIKPPNLSYHLIPTRLGYVMRCSDTEAIFMDEQTYIKEKEKFIKLQPIDRYKMTSLRKLYFEENTTSKLIYYPPTYFSMNNGDYTKPIL